MAERRPVPGQDSQQVDSDTGQESGNPLPGKHSPGGPLSGGVDQGSAGRRSEGIEEYDRELDDKLVEIFRPEFEAIETVASGQDGSGATRTADDRSGGPATGPTTDPITQPTTDPTSGPITDPATDPAGRPRARPATTDKDFFQAVGGWGALLDIGLPWIAFLIVYAVSDHDLQLSLIVAIASAAAVAVLRLLRKQPLRNIAGGFIGVLIAAYVANKSGRAEDVYLPGLLINAGYGALYLLTVLIRWPLFGVLYGVLTQTGTAWRKDPAMLRGFNRATLVFVGLFAVRLVVQLPLYLMGSLNALGIAKVALGLPLYALALWLAYVVLRASLPAEKWDEARDTVTHLLRGKK